MKILVLGPSGTGKTTICRELSKKLTIPPLHLDSIYWQENWGRIDKDDFHKYMKTFLLKNKDWVIDGNYTNNKHFKMRLALSDIIIYLDYGKMESLKGIHERASKFKHQVRSDMAAGCYEGIDHVFLNYVNNFDVFKGKYLKALIQKYNKKKKVLIFKNRKELYNWYHSL
jgi:adenylate kinase family enzyme